jgi:hypothetical protein
MGNRRTSSQRETTAPKEVRTGEQVAAPVVALARLLGSLAARDWDTMSKSAAGGPSVDSDLTPDSSS